MNAKPTAAPVVKKPSPQSSGGTHLQAAVILLLGCGAALAFRSDGQVATAPQSAGSDVLVRRIAPPQETVDRPTTQLLGYVEPETTTGIAARPERRTAAQVDRTVSWSEVKPLSPAVPRLTDVRPAEEPARSGFGAATSAFDGSAAYQTAAAAPPPWATMRPFDAPGAAGSAGLTSSPANVVRQHTVRDGDTLGDLAERYYGDPRRFRDIFDANRGTLTDPQLLPIGATLVIPAYDPRVTTPSTEPPAARLAPQGIITQP
jgi:nucleoid-associated protein YgaU